MGAGENAVLGLLLEIIAAGRGALIVVDEIELGLHAKAQSMLVRVLKEFCEKYHCQIICSTHSKMVLDELPLDARFLLEEKITQRISYPISPRNLLLANYLAIME
ncbi:MAG: AAA family ATPase [Hydrogeniiclostridium mannosilyticum]